MALSGCYALLKFVLVIVNLIFWLTGLTILIISVWMLTDTSFYLSVAQDESRYYIGLSMLLAVGAIMFIVGFFGCCGAYKENTWMLVSFFWVLLVILVAEIAAGAWAYIHYDELKIELGKNVKFTVQNEYSVIKTRTIAFDTIQKELACCGADGPMDWMNSKFNGHVSDSEKNIMDLSLSTVLKKFKVPSSCCKETASQLTCAVDQLVGVAASLTNSLNTEGCVQKMIKLLEQHMAIVIGVGFAIGVIEVLGLIISLVLCCAIRSTDRYKA